MDLEQCVERTSESSSCDVFGKKQYRCPAPWDSLAQGSEVGEPMNVSIDPIPDRSSNNWWRNKTDPSDELRDEQPQSTLHLADGAKQMNASMAVAIPGEARSDHTMLLP